MVTPIWAGLPSDFRLLIKSLICETTPIEDLSLPFPVHSGISSQVGGKNLKDKQIKIKVIDSGSNV